jgi:hypothetical protein
MRADARVRVQQPLQIYLECRGKSKKCDKQLTHIVRVIFRPILKVTYIDKLSRCKERIMRVFIVMVQFLLSCRRIAVQIN